MADMRNATTEGGPSVHGAIELVGRNGAHGHIGGEAPTAFPPAALDDQLEGAVGYRVCTSDGRVVGRLASVYHDPTDGKPDALVVRTPGWGGLLRGLLVPIELVEAVNHRPRRIVGPLDCREHPRAGANARRSGR